jgi:hypothetical protein
MNAGRVVFGDLEAQLLFAVTNIVGVRSYNAYLQVAGTILVYWYLYLLYT